MGLIKDPPRGYYEVHAAPALVVALSSIKAFDPDFLIQEPDGSYTILEIKADYQIDALVVQAKKQFVEQMAVASGMRYAILKSFEAHAGRANAIFPTLTGGWLGDVLTGVDGGVGMPTQGCRHGTRRLDVLAEAGGGRRTGAGSGS